jgi:hypothetical protein
MKGGDASTVTESFTSSFTSSEVKSAASRAATTTVSCNNCCPAIPPTDHLQPGRSAKIARR